VGTHYGPAHYRCRVSDRVVLKLRARTHALRLMAAGMSKPGATLQLHDQAATLTAQAEVLDDVCIAIEEANNEVAQEIYEERQRRRVLFPGHPL
jgi:hypothetical protein